MISIELCKKIIYAIEQASAARHNGYIDRPKSVEIVLDDAIDQLQHALRLACDAE